MSVPSTSSLQSSPHLARYVFLSAAPEVTEIVHPVHPRTETAVHLRLKAPTGRVLQETRASDDGLFDALKATLSSVFRSEYPDHRFPKVLCEDEPLTGKLCLRFKAHHDAPAHLRHPTVVLRTTYTPDAKRENFLKAASETMLEGVQTSYGLQGASPHP